MVDPGEGPGPSLLLDQNGAWMTGPHPPHPPHPLTPLTPLTPLPHLSTGLDPPLGAMGPILPAQVANQNTVFTSSCSLAISVM